MATTTHERTSLRRGPTVAVGLAALALTVIAALGVWQTQPAVEPVTPVVTADLFSPEVIRVRNTAHLYEMQATSPEAVRLRNTASLYELQATSPEAVRLRNTAHMYELQATSPEAVRAGNTAFLYPETHFSPEAVRARHWEGIASDSD